MTDFHRTNVNLNTSDVAWLRAKYGYGWTEKVRDIVHGYVTDNLETAPDVEIDQDLSIYSDMNDGK